MEYNQIQILESLQSLLAALPNPTTVQYLAKAFEKERFAVSIHLGIFIEPYLSYIFEMQKRWESRLSKNKIAPHGKVMSGDVILLKKSSGPILGMCIIKEVVSFKNIDHDSFDRLKKNYTDVLCASNEFWKQHEDASYATLMELAQVRRIDYPIKLIKKDRLPWVILYERPQNNQLTLETFQVTSEGT